MSRRKGINIETIHEDYWDYLVYTEIDYADTLTGFVKEHDDGNVEFVTVNHEAVYYEKDIDEMMNFIQQGKW